MEEIDAVDDVSVDQALQDLAELLADIELPKITYSAVYDPLTGEVSCIGPTESLMDEQYKILVDDEVAMRVSAGTVNINNCYVDLDSSELEIVELKNVFKIDDILHRVPVLNWAEVEKPELYITYYPFANRLVFQLSEELRGTKKLPEKFQPVKQKNTRWAGDTSMRFLLTDYNDPHAIHDVIDFKIDDLIGKDMIYRNIELPARFSIFTRRLFKNYVMDIK